MQAEECRFNRRCKKRDPSREEFVGTAWLVVREKCAEVRKLWG
jgi:hypothetical protein